MEDRGQFLLGRSNRSRTGGEVVLSKLLVSFVTRPGRGSEGGVGWAFVKVAAGYAAAHQERVHIVFDARDEASVRCGLTAVGATSLVVLHAVSLPRWALLRYGDSRSRASYLAWLPRARSAVRRICGVESVDLAHQVTFATATLPAALPRMRSVRRIWGPLAVQSGVVYGRNGQPSTFRQLAVGAGKVVSRVNVGRADVVIAQNELTATDLRGSHRRVQIEPNIVVDGVPSHERRDDHLLSMVGLLIDRKRPWIAVEALSHPSLVDYRLQVIGDGPLRSELESLVQAHDLGGRVSFLGHLEHAETLAALGRSRLLLHLAAREGAGWAVGETAALGIPAVVFDSVGAATAVRLSANGGEAVRPDPTDDLASAFAGGVLRALQRPTPEPSARWSSERLPALLEEWWSERR